MRCDATGGHWCCKNFLEGVTLLIAVGGAPRAAAGVQPAEDGVGGAALPRLADPGGHADGPQNGVLLSLEGRDALADLCATEEQGLQSTSTL